MRFASYEDEIELEGNRALNHVAYAEAQVLSMY
jgi:hypothetical protein